MVNILIAILFCAIPAPIIFLNNRFKVVEKLGIVLVCYLIGILVGNIGILPESFSGIQTTMQDVSVCLALPLILFSLDIKKALKTTKTGIKCMLLAIVSITIITFILQLIFNSNPLAPQFAGLAMGVYTGGTPNLTSIAKAIGVSGENYLIFNTYDMVISIVYMLVMLSSGKYLIKKLFRMKDFEGDKNVTVDGNECQETTSYKGMFEGKTFGKLMLALLLSAAILGVSYGVSMLFKPDSRTAITILLITTLSILCSFIKPVRNIKMTTNLGMYIIYIFCFTVATMADIRKLIHIDVTIIVYVTVAIYGTLILHALLSKIFKIDFDTMAVTSVSAICSPPFVPAVANSLKNNAALISGITTGIIGYAVGNYLGVAIYWLYSRLPF
ncbi:MAG: DUF819 family protein [Clostridia bacterium]|nr:DUF819 family protein [Clostridia bacterium]